MHLFYPTSLPPSLLSHSFPPPSIPSRPPSIPSLSLLPPSPPSFLDPLSSRNHLHHWYCQNVLLLLPVPQAEGDCFLLGRDRHCANWVADHWNDSRSIRSFCVIWVSAWMLYCVLCSRSFFVGFKFHRFRGPVGVTRFKPMKIPINHRSEPKVYMYM